MARTQPRALSTTGLIAVLASAGWVGLGACVLDRDGALPTASGGASTGSGAQGAGGQSSSSTSSTTGSGGLGGGGHGGATGGQGGVPGPDCSDGIVEPPEGCDDGNTVSSDGCSDCQVDPGYQCTGSPSICSLIPPQVLSTPANLSMPVPDQTGYYDGTPGTMACASLTFADQGWHQVQEVELRLAMTHSWVGDLVIKIISPAQTTTTVLSRPGYGEPSDTYIAADSDDSNLLPAHPITFRDGAPHDAEQMGDTIGNGFVVCRDDSRCEFDPHPGAGPGASLADFDGQHPVGLWQVCVGDADDVDVGSVQQIELTVLAW